MMRMTMMQTARTLILSSCLLHHRQLFQHLLRKMSPPLRAQMVRTCLLMIGPCREIAVFHRGLTCVQNCYSGAFKEVKSHRKNRH